MTSAESLSLVHHHAHFGTNPALYSNNPDFQHIVDALVTEAVAHSHRGNAPAHLKSGGQLSFLTKTAPALRVKIIQKGEKFGDGEGLHEYRDSAPLIEFYEKSPSSPLLCRFRWSTLDEFSTRKHGLSVSQHVTGVALKAEYPCEIAGAPLSISALSQVVGVCRHLFGSSI